MKNWKTTLFGFLTGLPVLLHSVGVPNIGHIGNGDFLSLLSGIGAILTGYFAKDKDVTGTDKP